MAFPKLESGLPTGTSGIGNIGGTDGGSGVSDLDLGKIVGGMGAMDLLGSQRKMTVHFNAVDVAMSLQQHRDRSAKQVIASLGASDA